MSAPRAGGAASRSCCGILLAVAALLAPALSAQAAASGGFWQRPTLSGDWGGVRPALAAAGIDLGLQEQDEVWDNLAGGLRRGVVFDGLTTASLSADLGRLVGWSGARAYASAYQIHGQEPTLDLVGGLQAISNLEATGTTRLFDLWIQQAVPGVGLSLRLGQEGLNDEFMVTRYGGTLIDSSFGFPALPSLDLPSGGPNYPLPALFARLKYSGGGLRLLGGVFNANPAGPGTGDPQARDASGTLFRIGDGSLAIAEADVDVGLPGGRPGTYKLGAWWYSGPVIPGSPGGQHNTYAVYALADQLIWHPPGASGRGIGVFAMVAGGPADRALIDLSVAAGLAWTGPLATRPDDVISFGLGYVRIGNALAYPGADPVAAAGFQGGETVLEATWLAQLTPWWSVQPDLQFVVNPGAAIPQAGGAPVLHDALLIGLRTSVTF